MDLIQKIYAVATCATLASSTGAVFCYLNRDVVKVEKKISKFEDPLVWKGFDTKSVIKSHVDFASIKQHAMDAF